ncbi:MAG: M48 family metallopeptidase [Elusimicrobia bacterium]|nr:M48 family metallopeptidase [Elusimicrobiota bacterium]
MKYTAKELKKNVNISKISPIKEFFFLLGGILGIILVIYVVLGFAVGVVVSKIDFDTEKRLERIFSKTYKINKRTDKEIRLQKFLDGLLKEFPKGKNHYNVRIVNNSKVNALALPGGNIVVFSSLINDAESENELVFVLAHELGHFVHKDHLRILGRGLVLLTISTALFGSESFITKFMVNFLSNVEMKFSQHQELLADQWALDLLNKRYGHVAGATDFFKKMAKKETKSHFLYFLATHPHPQERVKAIQERIQKKNYLIKEKIPLNRGYKSIN